MAVPSILRRLTELPTAAFAEQAVLEQIRTFCGRLAGVTLRADRYGNLLAHYARGPRRARPLVFVAHTDHPAFVAEETLADGTLRAAFRGGVRPEFFGTTPVRFRVGRRAVRAVIRELVQVGAGAPGAPGRPEEAVLAVERPVPAGTPGNWDLPPTRLEKDVLYAPACDDLAGVAALLALLERLARRRAAAETYCLFTRAEEVGFVGALGAIQARTIPRRLPVISVETSSALPHAPVGGGPILRVGDRGSVFDPALTAFCEQVAAGLAKRGEGFIFQRKLMDGGMCEALAFLTYGYRATGICLALGNYHNMNVATGRIDSEYISLADWQRMVVLFEALALDSDGPPTTDIRHRQSLADRFARYRTLL